MPIDIKKGDQVFGPHTVEELKTFVEQGEVALDDIVIKEDGERLSVRDFLAEPRPLKLKLAAPPVPVHAAATENPAVFAPSPSVSQSSRSPETAEVETTVYYKAAKFGVWVLLLSVIPAFVLPLFGGSVGAQPKAWALMVGGALMLTAIPAGLVALCGILTYGTPKLLWRGLVSVLVPAVIISAGAVQNSHKKANASNLAQMAASMNEVKGEEINGARLDGASVESGDTLMMKYTLTTVKTAELDRAAWAKIWGSKIVPRIKDMLIQSPEFSALLRGGKKIVGNYYDKDGVFVGAVRVTKDDLPKK